MIMRSLPCEITFACVTTIIADIVPETCRVIDAASSQGVTIRAFGGVAVAIHSASGVPSSLARAYRDIDLVTGRKEGRAAARSLAEAGYTPNERFNAMNGSTRLVFYDVAHERQVDVFVGEFRMCHQIPISNRLELEPYTVPLAELLLTKLQIVQLNDKDLRDIWAILVEHDVAENDNDAINAAFVASLLAGDWGLWRTTRQTIETARGELANSPLPQEDRALIESRLVRLWERIEAEPKGFRWRSRARVGDRSKWYEEPEEIAHAPSGGVA